MAERLEGLRPEVVHHWRQLRLAHGDEILDVNHQQFLDHIPHFLDALAEELRSPDPAGRHARQRVEGLHGAQRWQLGLGPVELVSEWFDLRTAILTAVVRDADPPELVASFRVWLQGRIEEGVVLSLSRHELLRQQAAAEHLGQLEQRVASPELKDEGAAWQEATHDLRGNLAILAQIAQRLRRGDATADPDALVEVLAQGLSNALDLLGDLQRTKAGPGQAYAVRDLAEEWAAPYTALLAPGQVIGLHGPASLRVTTDRAILRRIGQNLWQNAFRHTPCGRIDVFFGPRGEHGWYFRIRNRWEGPAVIQPGEGLGLGIIQRLVGELGGELHIRRHLHRFQVTVSLPR